MYNKWDGDVKGKYEKEGLYEKVTPALSANNRDSRMLSVVKGNDAGLKGFQTNKIQPKPVLRLHGFE